MTRGESVRTKLIAAPSPAPAVDRLLADGQVGGDLSHLTARGDQVRNLATGFGGIPLRHGTGDPLGSEDRRTVGSRGQFCQRRPVRLVPTVLGAHRESASTTGPHGKPPLGSTDRRLATSAGRPGWTVCAFSACRRAGSNSLEGSPNPVDWRVASTSRPSGALRRDSSETSRSSGLLSRCN